MSLDPTQHVSRRHEDEGSLEWREAFYGECGFFDLALRSRDYLRAAVGESLNNRNANWRYALIGTHEIDAELYDLWQANQRDWLLVMAEILG